MDVPTHDTIGLQIYRELIGRETRSVGTWEQTFGREVCAACIRSCHNACTLLSLLLTPPTASQALTKKKDPAAMVNLSTFDKAFAMPVPLEIQVPLTPAARLPALCPDRAARPNAAENDEGEQPGAERPNRSVRSQHLPIQGDARCLAGASPCPWLAVA